MCDNPCRALQCVVQFIPAAKIRELFAYLQGG
jgi:hypothetical protein